MTIKRWSAALLTLLAISCSDTDQLSPPPANLVTSELTFLRFEADAYQAAAKSGSFWAVPGQSRTLTLRYSDTQQEFLTFEVGPNSLQTQDSVLISVAVADNGHFLFHFSPSGLQFNRQAPAVLSLNRARTSDDVDGDGDVDLIDVTLSLGVGIWKQELPVTPWFKLPSISLGTVERTNVTDFTSFGMAVD